MVYKSIQNGLIQHYHSNQSYSYQSYLTEETCELKTTHIIRQLKIKNWFHSCCNSAYYSTNNGVRLFCGKQQSPIVAFFLEWTAVSYCLIVLFAPLEAINVIFALYWQPCGVVVHSYIFAAHLSESELRLSFFVRNRHCPVLSVDSIQSVNISTFFFWISAVFALIANQTLGFATETTLKNNM